MVQSRVERKRDRRTQEILAVAAELFGERGYDAVSLDDVAERLDVTKGSLYHYFSGKEELATAAVAVLGTAWMQRLAALPADGTPTSRLRELLREHVTIAVRDHPAALRVYLVPEEWPPAQRTVIKDLRRRHDRLFRDLVAEGVATGEFTVVDPDTALQCLHAATSQAPAWCRELDGPARAEKIERLVATLMMLVGVRPES